MDVSIVNKLINWSLYHSRTIWLFTRSDLKTIVVPSTLFAILYTSSELVSGTAPSRFPSEPLTLARGLLLTLLWIWINLLPFTIDNQRRPDSIAEDAANKPWRPLPARRITPRHAAALMLFSYSAALPVSLALGAAPQCVALMGLGACYNHLQKVGGNGSVVARNLLNGAGYMCFTSGALAVMTRALAVGLRASALSWIALIGAVVASSIHMLDLPDQVGDRARGRRTIPLVYGDGCARWSVALAVGVWSLVCAGFWGLGALGSVLPVMLGGTVVVKVLSQRTVEADKGTSLWYNIWIAGLFCLPMVKALQTMVS